MKEKKVTEYITDAVFDLLQEKNLEDITVTEIIQKAEVCRSSFYRNFYLPESVIRQYGAALFGEAINQLTADFNEKREHIHSIMLHLWAHRERLALLESRGLFHLLEEPIMNHCLLQLQRLGIQGNLYYAEYYAGAMTWLIRAWIHNGFREDPQQITQIICDLIK